MKTRKFSERLFLAVELPRFAREQIVLARKKWRKQLDQDVRWVPPLNLHLTLRYLGEVEVSKSKQLCSKLDHLSAETKAFLLSVDKVGASPSNSEAKSIFLRFEESPELQKFLQQIEGFCNELKLPKDKKPFEPKISLSRVFEPQPVPPLQIKPELKGFKLKNFALVESRLGQNGPSYYPLRRFELSGS